MAEQVRESGAEEVAIPDPAVVAGESAAMDSEVQIGEVDTTLLKAKTATEVATNVPDVDVQWHGAPTLCIQNLPRSALACASPLQC